MARRSAILALCLMTLVPLVARTASARRRPPAACTFAGKGEPPRHWIGCVTDAGPRRALSGRESVAVGLPIELNRATPEDLSNVPGLSPRLAIEVVADRVRRGPFEHVDALVRVRGIGPSRLARARPFLVTRP